jgi:hypothetical protein
MTSKNGFDSIAELAVDGLQYEVKADMLRPTDIWDEKDVFLAAERNSLEEWIKMDDETQEAIYEIVDRSLDRLKDRLDIWVPKSLTIEQGQYLDIRFRLLFSDLEKEKKAKQEITARKIREAAEGTALILEEMESRGDGDES